MKHIINNIGVLLLSHYIKYTRVVEYGCNSLNLEA